MNSNTQTQNERKITRIFGKERNLGDIIYNPQTKSVFCSLDLGFFGQKNITLVKRQADGCYDLMVSKYNSEETIKVGQTFPVKDKHKNIIEGLTQTTLGLLTEYNKEKQKNVTCSNDCLKITTHKLKEPQSFGNKGFKKLGWISGQFALEVNVEDIPATTNNNNMQYQPDDNIPTIDIDNDEIPF